MDSFEGFKKVIKDYLSQMADMDEMFAEKFSNPDKNIDDCCKYILEVVKNSAKGGCIGCADDEIYALAVHYYEEDIKDIKDVSKNVIIVSNQEIEFTEEEKNKIKEEALEKAINEKKEELKKDAIDKYIDNEIVLTEEDIKKAHELAFDQLVNEEKNKIKTNAKPKKKEEKKVEFVQTSLFD